MGDCGAGLLVSKRREARERAREHGEILSRLHWQCWREDAPAPDVTDIEFVSVMPVLVRSGSVGMVWPRLRERFDANSAVAMAMEAAFAAQVAHNARVAENVADGVRRLRAVGIEPMLVKGLAMAGQYPDHLVRPAGDIDFVVRSEDLEPARQALAGSDAMNEIGVDLQDERAWFDRPEPGFRERGRRVDIGGEQVLVPGPEDRLRLHSLHLIRHGGRRALWLADIGVALDALDPGFDAGTVFGTDRVRATWLGTVIRLAGELAGAEAPPSMPLPDGEAPAWLVREVMCQWSETDPFPTEVFGELSRNPMGIVSTFRRRWPPPIRATWLLHRPFTDAPRLPIQVAAYVKLIGSYALFRLPKQAARSRS